VNTLDLNTNSNPSSTISIQSIYFLAAATASSLTLDNSFFFFLRLMPDFLVPSRVSAWVSTAATHSVVQHEPYAESTWAGRNTLLLRHWAIP
jgi:hypothetical protein